MAPQSPARKSRKERASYTQRRAQRTEKAPMKGARWSPDDARTALDMSLSVPEVALRLGRTAAAVEVLRARWRAGQLSSALADQLPPPPSPGLKR
ncbi:MULTISPECIES: hypothetical protein [Mycolicibacter]|uniref:Helix-turn-helix domain-containing protein n=2 Tax=Mycolicibacter TaxID=1073531 RepID=A0ABU5XNU5_9MYCO|nr:MULTISPECIES: hypothetical protein [unclassified Mycolicibacter]MEB3023442.1 hypothetical protein [Mycolicibacter sp. MYC098]MEB3033784.1 hypothetical protein [Mycolicibacter sp. MYC340]